jgi:hypothetical protein
VKVQHQRPWGRGGRPGCVNAESQAAAWACYSTISYLNAFLGATQEKLDHEMIWQNLRLAYLDLLEGHFGNRHARHQAK